MIILSFGYLLFEEFNLLLIEVNRILPPTCSCVVTYVNRTSEVGLLLWVFKKSPCVRLWNTWSCVIHICHAMPR